MILRTMIERFELNFCRIYKFQQKTIESESYFLKSRKNRKTQRA